MSRLNQYYNRFEPMYPPQVPEFPTSIMPKLGKNSCSNMNSGEDLEEENIQIKKFTFQRVRSEKTDHKLNTCIRAKPSSNKHNELPLTELGGVDKKNTCEQRSGKTIMSIANEENTPSDCHSQRGKSHDYDCDNFYPLFENNDIPIYKKNHFIEFETLGHGGQAKVTKVYHKKREMYMALKICHPNKIIFSEALIMKKIHQNLNMEKNSNYRRYFLQYVDIYKMEDGIYGLMMEQGLCSMRNLLKGGKVYSESEIWNILSDFISALYFLQIHGIFYGDIKPHNIILTLNEEKNLQYKIADFGLSIPLHKNTNKIHYDQIKGFSEFYTAPELRFLVEKSNSIDDGNKFFNPFKSDVYSLGLVALEMLHIKKDTLSRENVKNSDLYDLIKLMLEPNPVKRPDFIQLRKIFNEKYEKFPVVNREHIKNDEFIYYEEYLKKKKTKMMKMANFDEIAYLYLINGNIEKTIEYFKTSLDNTKKIFQKNQKEIEIANLYEKIGYCYHYQKKFEEGETHLLKALEIKCELLGEMNEECAKLFNDIGVLYYNSGKLDKAKLLLKKASEIRNKIFGNENISSAVSLINMACLDLTHNEIGKTERKGKKLIEIITKLKSEKKDYIEISFFNYHLQKLYKKKIDFPHNNFHHLNFFNSFLDSDRILSEVNEENIKQSFDNLLNSYVSDNTNNFESKCESEAFQSITKETILSLANNDRSDDCSCSLEISEKKSAQTYEFPTSNNFYNYGKAWTNDDCSEIKKNIEIASIENSNENGIKNIFKRTIVQRITNYFHHFCVKEFFRKLREISIAKKIHPNEPKINDFNKNDYDIYDKICSTTSNSSSLNLNSDSNNSFNDTNFEIENKHRNSSNESRSDTTNLIELSSIISENCETFEEDSLCIQILEENTNEKNEKKQVESINLNLILQKKGFAIRKEEKNKVRLKESNLKKSYSDGNFSRHKHNRKNSKNTRNRLGIKKSSSDGYLEYGLNPYDEKQKKIMNRAKINNEIDRHSRNIHEIIENQKLEEFSTKDVQFDSIRQGGTATVLKGQASMGESKGLAYKRFDQFNMFYFKREHYFIFMIKKLTRSNKFFQRYILDYPGVSKVFYHDWPDTEDSQEYRHTQVGNYALYIVMTKGQHDLSDMIKQKKHRLSPLQIFYLVFQMTTFFAFLQRNRMAHNDIKPQNIVYVRDSLFPLKIIDWGSACLVHKNFDRINWERNYTERYAAPEILNKKKYINPFKTNVFSWGITAKEMLECFSDKEAENYGIVQKLFEEMLEQDRHKRPDFLQMEKKFRDFYELQVARNTINPEDFSKNPDFFAAKEKMIIQKEGSEIYLNKVYYEDEGSKETSLMFQNPKVGDII